MFGLKDKDIAEIVSILDGFQEVEQALIFGSRAKGNHRNGSDVDIAIKGQEADFNIALTIAGILNEDTTMPYHFDVLSYTDLNNKDLAAHIDRVGKLLYQTKVKIH
ncbi:nucleotidyltransferase domain-containing protein [Reichenbachiella sp. MALMAid0571]|uniref:nucleotidyltransferase domain-containing protein n=1 Tax=Reichenbachiella sp. MALMAid0571 TaxID=3143939 RepID=UPI0032DFC991